MIKSGLPGPTHHFPESEPGLPPTNSPLVGILLDHWVSIRRDLPLPKRADIDPTGFFRCLPYMWIYRYVPDRGDFICELSGDEINSAWKKNIVGQWMKDLFDPRIHDILLARWHYLLEQRLVMKTDCNIAEKLSYKPAERLTLPVLGDSGNADTILGITIYRYRRLQDDDKEIAPPDETPRFYDCRF